MHWFSDWHRNGRGKVPEDHPVTPAAMQWYRLLLCAAYGTRLTMHCQWGWLCSFWATVCKTVRPMLLVRCLSVSDVGVLWPNGWTDQDETWQAGRPQPSPDCVRWGPSYRAQIAVYNPRSERQTDTRLTASFQGNLGKPASKRLNQSGF